MKKVKNLYCLLVGINDYPDNPLRGCVSDVNRMEKYFASLKSTNKFGSIEIVKLINEQANKQSIVENIQTHLAKATDDDVAVFYYSGHGANESAGGLFKDEHDDLLECIVCCPMPGQQTQYLLADKELRYLFHKLPNNPHMVTVFDACHSGDMTRGDEEAEDAPILKRLSKAFPTREYTDFIFNAEISKEDLENKDISDLIPNKNHVHIAACLSHESSWEKKGSGVFTSYLLNLLEGLNNEINYLDISRYAKMSLRSMTQTQQTPTINSIGTGNTNQLSSWLNMHDEISPREGGALVHHGRDGWIYTYGKLMGLEDGAEVTITQDKKTYKTKIKETFLDYSIVEQLPEMAEWDTNTKVDAATNTVYAPLGIYLNGQDQKTVESIKAIINKKENVKLVEKDQASHYLNIFNLLVYFSKKDDPYRPIAKQYDLLDEKIKMDDFINDQLNYLIKWNHFNTLQNPTHPFNYSKDGKVIHPIEADFYLFGEDGDGSTQKPPKNIIEDSIEFPAVAKRHSTKGYYYNRFRVHLKNTSDQELYVGVLRLGTDLSIDCYCNDEVVRLTPKGTKGSSIDLYTSKPDKNVRRISFYDYQEGYNWRNEEILFKFIVNTEDFTPTFQDMAQPTPGLPYLPSCTGESSLRSSGRSATVIISMPMQWDVYTSSIKLTNPSYNKIAGRLKDCPQKMDDDEWFGPFIPKLYDAKTLETFQFKAKERG